MKQLEDQKKQAKRDQLENHKQSLQNQIEATRQNKQREREKSREPYETSINGLREHSPDFIQNRQANKSAERERLRENLMEQMAEKRKEKEKESSQNPGGTSLQVSGVYNNPYIDNSKPLSHILEEQIYSKNMEKEQRLKVTAVRIIAILIVTRKRKKLPAKRML